MTISATTALSAATVTAGQKSTATLTITNASTSSVTISAVTPRVTPNGQNLTSVAAMVGNCTAGKQGFTVTVAGSSGTATVQFDVTPLAPPSGVYATSPFPSGITPAVPLAMPAQQVLAVGADIIASDGSTCAATTTTLTVNGQTR
jgi:hypothetical protein